MEYFSGEEFIDNAISCHLLMKTTSASYAIINGFLWQ